MAAERPHVKGLLHGTSWQWNRKGELLGTFRMRMGTGTQSYWHYNGQLRTEIPTKRGIPVGSIRRWKADGTELQPISANA